MNDLVLASPINITAGANDMVVILGRTVLHTTTILANHSHPGIEARGIKWQTRQTDKRFSFCIAVPTGVATRQYQTASSE
ncbi:MAG: hypothetical protein ACRCXB_28875, partial [Aeromonadaceae bacterium]